MNKKLLCFALTAVALGCAGTVNASDTLGTYDMDVTAKVISASDCVISAPTSLTFDNISGPDEIRRAEDGPRHAQLYMIDIVGCHQGLHVSATVLGTADAVNGKLLSTQSAAAGAAQNVAIGFYEQVGIDQHPLVPINSGTTTSRNINEMGEAHIAIQADVVLSDNTKFATAGTIAANANVQINFL